MKVTEYLQQAKSTLISFEILPPLKGKSIESLYSTLDPLMEFRPPFINVTYHRAEYMYKRNNEGLFEKKIIRKRPGTVGICAAIQNKYHIDSVPHIVCGGFTLEDTEDALVDLHFLGINNILVIRGDPSKNESQFEPEPGGHRFAIHLMKQVMNMNHGIYLEDDLNDGVKTDFCIGVAGYPEKHYEAPNMQSDLLHLKSKVEAGASYIITQMFFDTGRFIEFVKACRALGITVPIIPGIKPLTQKKHVNTLPRLFHITIPEELAKAVNQCRSDEDAAMVGVEWCIQQCKELMEFNVPLLHFYTMSNSVPVKKVVASLF